MLVITSFQMSCKAPVHPVDPIIKKDNVFEQEVKNNRSRDVWQQPAIVLDQLGDIAGLTIADIGAGTGFFSFRLLLRNANVIAIDIDPKMLAIIEGFKLNLDQNMQEHISTRLALPNDPMITQDEADIVLIINTIGFIESRVDYIRNIYNLLPDGGRLVIIDFKSKELPIETPGSESRVPLFQIEKDLKNAGFSTINSNDSLLDYQYMVAAEK